MNEAMPIALVLLLPLACFVCLGLAGKKHLRKSAGAVAVTILLLSAALAIYAAWHYFTGAKPGGAYPALVPFTYKWLPFYGNLSIDIGFLLDPISIMMVVVVTFISLMVHVFSLGYLKGEPRITTYYSFLSLFTFSMLGLVLSSNILQLYIFWELVGLSSYLLIGFYTERPAAVAAAKKAFVVTRFADLGLLIGILILSFQAETLDFRELLSRLTDHGSSQFAALHGSTFLGASLVTWALILVFAGGAGKSAMFPLHIWLPDAMEGPTPVSALIHAATMVVAGVFLVARLFPVFSESASVMQLIKWVGAGSAIFAAVIACTQTDIKRVLAYSTMSQIGFMMFALGLSGAGHDAAGYTASMFHLFTHAFFKSLLFLCAGAIIHAVHSNELKDMGGLRNKMRITHVAFLIACLAIAGIPPFSGFFSKEAILATAFHADPTIYVIALLTSGITAFYMFRLYFSIFWHAPAQVVTAHGDGDASMKIPLVILSACALTAGFIPFAEYVTAGGRPETETISLRAAIAPVGMALAGIALAMALYLRRNNRPQLIAAYLGSLYEAVYKKFYVDEIYRFLFRNVVVRAIAKPAAWIDKHIVDGAMNGIASGTARLSQALKGMQSGKVQDYAIYFFAGFMGLALLCIYLWH